MDTTEIAKEIERIMDIFGMTGVKAAEIMGFTVATFRNRKNPKNEQHKFVEKNIQDLKAYIRTEAGKM